MFALTNESQRSLLDFQRELAQWAGIVRGGTTAAVIRRHLETLGDLGVKKISELIQASTRSAGLATGWQYEITANTIKWFHRDGTRPYRVDSDTTIELILHFLDEGTAAHGPNVAAYMHFWIGGVRGYQAEIYTKWVAGIKPHYFFKQLEDYILAEHERLLERFLEDVRGNVR